MEQSLVPINLQLTRRGFIIRAGGLFYLES
jgi:hypothetical protein